ncbi:MAG: protein kinase [Holophagales bacterium]|nr:protein kinase [Holophagales bacterium]
MTGQQIAHYRLTAKLGEGGMGEVWRAQDTKLGREVAVKLLPAAFTADAERLARFEREAQLLAQLNHPNVAQIYGLETSGETHALVLELVEGPTLAEELKQGPLPLDEALAIARQIAEAFEEAHGKGIVHRDLKPQNVKVTEEGKVKVLDFGLARAIDPGSSGSARDLAHSPTLTSAGTQLGVILGTAAYMAPEQAKGKSVDKRADIWAFGVVLFEMLSSARLFAGETVTETLAGVLKGEIDFAELPPATPARIRRLLRRCLERDPRNRLHDIADARIVLDEVLGGAVDADDAAPAAPAPAAAPAKRSVTLPIATVAAVGVALAAGYWLGHRGAGAPVGRGAEARAPHFQKLTFRPGIEGDPALSPDGKSLFFAAAREGSVGDLDIFFAPVGGKRPIDLTADSTDDDFYPAVSPDGRTVAFRSERAGGGIYLMGTTGESPRRLIDDCFDPAWSPGGDRIVCTTVPTADPFNRGGSGRLRIVDVASGAATELASGDAAAPAWSPDGRRIAYWGLRDDESGRRDLWSVAVSGGEPVELTNDDPFDWNPVWSDDGSHLYFLSDRGGAPNLWRLAVDRASGRPLGAPESVGLPTEFALSADRAGGRWAYTSRSMRSIVERRELDPERRVVGERRQSILETTTLLQSVSLSPDGATIAYSTLFPRQDLFVARLDGGTPVQLTDDPARDRFVSWDPDGSRIVFMSSRGGRYEQWAIRPDGSGLEQLSRSREESSWSPALSPDRTKLSTRSERGTQIFAASGATPWEAVERIPAGDDPKEERFQGFLWSPSGDRLAGIVRPQTSAPQAAVWSFAERRLVRVGPEGDPVAWYPDGKSLLVAVPKGLAVLDLSTGALRAVAGAGPADIYVAGRDLRTLLVLSVDDEADVWLAEGLE